MKPLYHPYFVNFIIYFNTNQDFFECHEVLEDYWNEIPNRTKKHPLTAFILLATGLYHWRRGNVAGALRTCKKASKKMEEMPEQNYPFTEGIDFPNLYNHLQNTILSIESRQPFNAFKIIITSKQLQSLVDEEMPRMTILPKDSAFIIDKHKLRDRSDIIKLRDEKKKGER